MSRKKKGCVYFMKHVGIDAIKIGYTDSEGPYERYVTMKTYSPYGSELIGFFNCYNPSKMESRLHKKYSKYRLEGEWFEISAEKAKKEIEINTDIEDAKEREEFFLRYAMSKNKKDIDIKTDNFILIFNNIVHLNKVYNKLDMLNILEEIHPNIFDKNDLNKILKSLELEYKSHRVNGKTKKGVKINKKLTVD